MNLLEIGGSFLIVINSFIFKPHQVQKEETPYVSQIEFKTQSAFTQKEVIEEEEIPFKEIKKDDEDLEMGLEEVKEEGENGKYIRKYLVTYWGDKDSDQKLLSEEKVEPKDKVIAVGTKIIWRDVNTPEGERKFWKKIPNVWATSYDKSCLGCDEWTALGTRLDVGTCAVDPKVIKMWTEIYVPGYGICRALDVGGGIKGNKIDVGFYDLHAQSAEVGWTGSHFTDIYLLDNAP